MDKGTGEASTEPGFIDIKNPLGEENSLLLGLERMIWMGKRKIFPSLLDEVVHYSIGRFNLGIIFGFLLLFLFSNSGSLGEFAVSLILLISFFFSCSFFSEGDGR